MFKKGKEETPLQPLTQPLVCEFENVSPTRLTAGLPLIRDVEHQIDLLPGASLQNLTSYRASPKKLRSFNIKFKSLLMGDTSGRV